MGRSIVLAGLFAFSLPPASTASGPPRLASLVVTGNDAVTGDDILSAVGLRRGTPLTDSSVSAAIGAVAGLYRSRAYYGAEALAALVNYTPDSADADLSIAVREGTRATFGRLELRGNGALPADVAAGLFPLSEGDPLDPGAIEAGLAAILGWYERAGYPFASASVAGIDDAGGGAMTLTIGIVEGGAATIAEIRVTGNTETAERVIVREARMDVPGPYDPAAVARFTGRLRRLGIFSFVSEPTLYQIPAIAVRDTPGREPGGYGLLVNVAEGRTSTFDGILGYAPAAAGTGAGNFSGSVLLGFRNLFGTGRKLDASWMKPGTGTQEIRLSYEEPWAFGFPVNLGGGFLQRRQDTTYVETRWKLSAEFLASASLSVSGIVESQGVVPSSGPAGEGQAGQAGIEGSTTLTGGAVVRYDTRDDRETPRRGADFRSEYRSGKKTPTAGGAARATVRHIGFDFDLYIPAGDRQVIAVALHGREVSTDNPGPADLYRLGGFRTLRGFREEQFSGVRTAWGAAEYRFLAGGRSFFYGFFDPGYVKEAADAGDFFTYGYGIGMRLETGIGLIGVNFALGEGDPIAQTKIHFGLINSF